MTDEPTNGGPRPRTKTRAEERADAVKTPTRLELAERIEELERELGETRAQGRGAPLQLAALGRRLQQLQAPDR